MSTFYQLLGSIPESEQEPDNIPNEEISQQEADSYNIDDSIFDGLPDGWRPKEKFATSQDELQFYREKYPGLWKHINSDAFLDQFLNTYEGQIANKEKEVKNVAQLVKALNNDPEAFIAAHLPDYAEKMGVGRLFTSDEIGEFIEQKIGEEFGENWRDVYNPADLVRRNSVTSQIQKRTQELEQRLEEYNLKTQRNREKYLLSLSERQQQQQPQGPMTEKQLDGILDQMIDGYFGELKDTGLSEEEFIEMAIASFQHQPTMRDIYRIMQYDKIMEQERNRAYEEGRKAMLNEFKKGSKRAALDYVPNEESRTEYRPKSFMGLRLGDGL